jgi:hypothetical protein
MRERGEERGEGRGEGRGEKEEGGELAKILVHFSTTHNF